LTVEKKILCQCITKNYDCTTEKRHLHSTCNPSYWRITLDW